MPECPAKRSAPLDVTASKPKRCDNGSIAARADIVRSTTYPSTNPSTATDMEAASDMRLPASVSTNVPIGAPSNLPFNQWPVSQFGASDQ